MTQGMSPTPSSVSFDDPLDGPPAGTGPLRPDDQVHVLVAMTVATSLVRTDVVEPGTTLTTRM